MTGWVGWLEFVLFFGVGVYLTPGLVALHSWMCARRDEMANRAKIAKRERR